MRLSGNANIAGTAMSKVSEGLRVSSGAAVNVSGIHLSATGIGFRVATGGQLRVGRSVIGAGALAVGHVSYGSHNSLPEEKLRWYGLAAAVAAASACMLELLRRLREKAEDRTWLFPAGVFNTR
jgi:hypothetical protein